MSTKSHEIVSNPDYMVLWEMFGAGSGLGDEIQRVSRVATNKRELKDWLTPRSWTQERDEWETNLDNFTSFVERGDDSSRFSGRVSVQEHPEHFMIYLLGQIEAIQSDQSLDYKSWQAKHRRLQGLNVGNQTDRKDLSHAIINDMIVYLQEKWVIKMAPEVYQIGKNLVSGKLPIPEKMRYNSHFATELFKDLLAKEGVVDQETWESNGGHIYGSFKSYSSAVKEAMLRREDLWETLREQAIVLGISSDNQADKMMGAWESVRLISQIIEKGNTVQKEYWREVIKEQVNQMEHLVRCRVYFDDPEAFNHAMEKGLDIVGEYSPRNRNEFPNQIGAKEFMALDTPDAYYRSATLARDGGDQDSGTAIDGKKISFAQASAFWFATLNQSPNPDKLIPIRLSYLHYPMQITQKDGRWELIRKASTEVDEKNWTGGSIEMEMSWWEILNDLHRWIWDRRASGMELDRDWVPILRQLPSMSREIEKKWCPDMRVIPWESVLKRLELVDRKDQAILLNE